MSGSAPISRRCFVGGMFLASLSGSALAQGFAGLGESADGFAAVVPRRAFHFLEITARIRSFGSSGGT